jgi:predicted naringenin-chalcone synthase
MVTSPPVLAGVGVAYPPRLTQQDLWDGYFDAHYAGVARGLAKRVFANSGVTTRHAVVNPMVEDPSRWSTEVRMQRYLVEALPLGKDAVSTALDRACVAAHDVGLLVVCSCTGYATPGLDILLARDLGLPADARRVFVGHMGCYAALPGLGVVADYVTLHGRPAVLLCLELPSVHVQPATVDPQQVVAHALFSVGEISSLTDTTTADHMTWHITDLGFRMGLSPHVPDVLSRHVRALVDPMLGRAGLVVADVPAWSVHPGGPRILDVVAREIGLTNGEMAASRAGLSEHGNCSSPTVLLILDRLLRAGSRPPAMLMAFGPGLTLYAALLG